MLFAPKEKGQGLVEYAIILVLIFVVVIAVVMSLGVNLKDLFGNISNSLPLQ